MQKMQVFPLPKTIMMKRFAKKVLAAATAASMMVSMSGISVCAADAGTKTTDTTNVTYEVSESYSWTVPSTITLGTTEVSDNVSVTSCIIPEGKKLQITAAGSGTGGAFTVAAGSQTLAYTITVGSASDSLAINGEVLAVNAGTNTGSASLKFKLAEDAAATMAGTYSGSVTYTASVVAQ